MMVCHCATVSDRRIRELSTGGTTTLESVGQACGAGQDCGSCIARIKAILDRELVESSVLLRHAS